MNELTIEDLLEEVIQIDNRYNIEAYLFIREGLDYTADKLNKPRHVSGIELLEGIRAVSYTHLTLPTNREV